MVSVVAKKLHKARQEKGVNVRLPSSASNLSISALGDLFEKADVTKDGSITVHEFLALCEEHGAHISDEDLDEFHKRADENGEVIIKLHIQMKIQKINLDLVLP